MKIEIDATPAGLALAIVAAGAVLAVWAYTTRYPVLPPRRRWILLGVRLLTVAALLVASLAPVIRYPDRSRARNRLLVLVDHSGSMRVRDAAGGRTRRAVADSVAEAVAGSAAGRYDVRVAAFDASLGAFGRGARAAEDIAAAPEGEGETALGDALRSSLTRVDPDSVAAILVVSDGAVNRGEDPERALGAALPAFGLVVGRAEEPPTVGIAGVEIPPEVIVGRPAAVVVTVRQGARESSSGIVRVAEEGRELARAPFSLQGAGASSRVTVPVTVTSRGKRFLSIELSNVANDPIRENKERLVAVTGRPARRSVPLLAREWDWDLRAFARGVEADTAWGVVRLEPAGASQVATLGGSPTILESHLATAEAVAVRMDPRVLTADRAAALLRYIERGGGALLWVDPLGRAPDSSPLARALRLSWRYWGETPGARATAELAPAGRSSEAALLGGDATAAAAKWKELPPVQPLVAFGTSESPLVPVLNARLGAETVPLLLTGSIGKGRVAVLNAAGVYRWGLTAAGIGSAGSVEDAFFGSLVRWLSAGSEERPVRIAAPDITPVGRPVPVKLTAAGPAAEGGATPGSAPPGSAPGGAAAQARIVARRLGGGSGNAQAPVARDLSSSGGAFSGSLELPEGIYQITGRVERGGRLVGSDSVRVAVGSQGIEFETLAADPQVLERLTEDSGGAAAPVDSAGPVLEALLSPDLARARLAEIDLFQNRLLFLVLILGLALEWTLRRRFNLM